MVQLQGPTPDEWDFFWGLGDVNRDGFVSLLDESLLYAAWEAVPGDNNWNPEYDLNQDGIINIYDIVIVGTHLGINIWDYFGYEKPFDISPYLVAGGALFILVIALL